MTMTPTTMMKLAGLAKTKARHKAHKHVAIVVRGGNFISVSFNHDRTHAEVAALKALWPSERRGTKVISLRMRRDGELGMAKPCESCEAYLRANGVKTVFYSDNDGNMQKMKL